MYIFLSRSHHSVQHHMATAGGKAYCVTCKKEKVTFKCGGCSEEFCYKHLGDHQQELSRQFDELEVNRDVFKQSLTEYIAQTTNDQLIERIEQWKQRSITIIQQTAEETKQTLVDTQSQYFGGIEEDLNKLTDQLRQTRKDNDFNEISLRHFQNELDRLTRALEESLTISVEEDPTLFITKIFVDTSGR